MENESKLRLLYIYKILHEKTDESHTLTTTQIIDILKKDYNISAHRVTVGTDIDVLREFGIDVCKIESTQNKYFIPVRTFELPEIKLLLDAVSSSRLITDKKAKQLSKKIASLLSEHQANDLKRNICSDAHFKAKNEKIYYIIDTINEAINSGKRIAFKYTTYNVSKQRVARHDGEIYTFSPYALVWSDDYYYTIGFSHKYNTIGCFRVDRIEGTPEILAQFATAMPKDFDITEYVTTSFRMFGGERENVTLICENGMMDAIIDKFGESATTHAVDEKHFALEAPVCINSIFFRWVFGFGGRIKISSPASVKEKYAGFVKAAYENL